MKRPCDVCETPVEAGELLLPPPVCAKCQRRPPVVGVAFLLCLAVLLVGLLVVGGMRS